MPTSAPSSMGRSEQMDSAMPSMKRSPLEGSGGSDVILQPPLPSPPGLSGRQPDASAVPHPVKIRFAPLPSPQRQRSLSTGRNINMEATMTSDGTRIAKLAKRIPGKDGEWDGDPYDEHAIDDEDEEEEESVKRSWRNMGMGNWSRTSTGSISGATSSYTMRLLKPLRGNDAEPMDKVMMAKALEGAPLKKSVSTGGLIGSSPFRSSAEKARKSSFRSGGTSGSFYEARDNQGIERHHRSRPRISLLFLRLWVANSLTSPNHPLVPLTHRYPPHVLSRCSTVVSMANEPQMKPLPVACRQNQLS